MIPNKALGARATHNHIKLKSTSVNTRKHKLIGFSLSQMLGLPSQKESEQTYASPTRTYLLLNLNSSVTIIPWQYQTLMTVYSNCSSSVRNALVTGLWLYIVYLFNSPFLNVWINTYMCHQNTHTSPFTDIFWSYCPTNKVGWGRKIPAKPTAPLAAVLEHLSHEIWHSMWCWHWQVRNRIFKHNSDLSSPAAPQPGMSPRQNSSSESLQVLRGNLNFVGTKFKHGNNQPPQNLGL